MKNGTSDETKPGKWWLALSACPVSVGLLLATPFIVNVEGPNNLILIIPIVFSGFVHLLCLPLSFLMVLLAKSRVGLICTMLYCLTLLLWVLLF